MTMNNAALANNPRLPKGRKGMLPKKQWFELYDCLILALDALGQHPEDFTEDSVKNAALYQSLAAKITHKALVKTGAMQ